MAARSAHERFGAFLDFYRISYTQAGREIGASHVTVYHWTLDPAAGGKTPNQRNRDRIETWTSRDKDRQVLAGGWPDADDATDDVTPFEPQRAEDSRPQLARGHSRPKRKAG